MDGEGDFFEIRQNIQRMRPVEISGNTALSQKPLWSVQAIFLEIREMPVGPGA